LRQHEIEDNPRTGELTRDNMLPYCAAAEADLLPLFELQLQPPTGILRVRPETGSLGP
jgi:hypothetical protein